MSQQVLLEYVFPITAIIPIPAASTAFLKQAIVVGKPKDGGVTAGVLHLATNMAQVKSYLGTAAAAEAQELFNAGMSRVFVLPMDNLDLAAAMELYNSEAYTLLISSDYTDAEITVAAAYGTATITAYASLLTTTADTVTVGATVFTAQAAAVTPGDATFQAATSNDATAASLVSQINSHPVASQLVVASAVAAVVTLTAVTAGSSGNNIALVYTDNGASVGMTLAHVTSGKITGGAGLTQGKFQGVIGVASTDLPFLLTQRSIEKRAPFWTSALTKEKNMFYAFGKMLSNSLNWNNQQFISMPYADDIDEVGEAMNLFDNRIGFVLSDSDFGNRLGFFVAGGQAIVAPYITKNLEVDMQSAAVRYIGANQPGYTLTQAALLEDELQKVIDSYIQDRKWIEDGKVEIKLLENNFVASGFINMTEPKALWRINGQLSQTL